MAIPEAVQRAIEEGAAQISAPALNQAAAELGREYHQDADAAPGISSPAARIAYLVTRMPAIFQVNEILHAELQELCPGIEIRSLLDLGSGPGTAALAAQLTFGELHSATLVDRDREWLEWSGRLIAAAGAPLAGASRLVTADLPSAAPIEPHDLVIISYVLGEMAPREATVLSERAWRCARRAIVVVEPGTPRGFAAIIAAREALIADRAFIVAPCTHAARCPLAPPDWCHFDTRVERTPLHQRVKSGARPYEIEKFSYLIAAKEPPAIPPNAARIIRHPLKRSGHVILDLCTSGAAAQRQVISRRDKQSYRPARSAKWGDLWIEST